MDADDDVTRQLMGLGGGESRCSGYTGTKALMLAVLEDGIRAYCGAPGCRRTEAECWLRSTGRGVFSFDVVCETLGLEPTAVRQAAARLKKQPAPSGRIRQNVRRDGPSARSR